MVSDAFGCPTATMDIAEAILLAVRRITEKASAAGTYHFAGTGSTSWHGFAEEIVQRQALFTGRSPRVMAIGMAEHPRTVRRPANAELDSSKFYSVFGYRARPWQERVGEVVAVLLNKSKPAEAKPSDSRALEIKPLDPVPTDSKVPQGTP